MSEVDFHEPGSIHEILPVSIAGGLVNSTNSDSNECAESFMGHDITTTSVHLSAVALLQTSVGALNIESSGSLPSESEPVSVPDPTPLPGWHDDALCKAPRLHAHLRQLK